MAKIKIENGTLFNMMNDLLPNNQTLNLFLSKKNYGVDPGIDIGQISSFLTGEGGQPIRKVSFRVVGGTATLNNSILTGDEVSIGVEPNESPKWLFIGVWSSVSGFNTSIKITIPQPATGRYVYFLENLTITVKGDGN